MVAFDPMANNRLYILAPDGAMLYLAKSNHGPRSGWTLQCNATEFYEWTVSHPGNSTEDGAAPGHAYRLVDDGEGE